SRPCLFALCYYSSINTVPLLASRYNLTTTSPVNLTIYIRNQPPYFPIHCQLNLSITLIPQPIMPTLPGQSSSPLTTGAKTVTTTLGNAVGGLTETLGNTVGAAGRGLGDTVQSVAGKAGRPVASVLTGVGNGVQDGAKSVAGGVHW
ncbi:hypothetical protein EDC01DRAFT_760250, partial [Geopyxis carbonaria]